MMERRSRVGGLAIAGTGLVILFYSVLLLQAHSLDGRPTTTSLPANDEARYSSLYVSSPVDDIPLLDDHINYWNDLSETEATNLV